MSDADARARAGIEPVMPVAVTVGGERPSDRMQRLGARWTLLGDYLPLEEELAQVRAVTLDDLRDVARRYPLEPKTTGILKPAD